MINNRGNKNKKLLFIIAIIVCIFFVLGLILIIIPKTENISYKIHYDGVSGNGVIFRDETYYDLSSYEKVLYENVVESQYVNAGTEIAFAYKKGYIKNTLVKLAETEKSIALYQNQNIITSFDDKNIKNFDFEIDVVIKKMSEENNGYIELYSTLCDLISARQQYIRNNYNTENNEYLQSLYADEKNMTEALKTWCDTFSSSENCFVGFYCDGKESLLNAEKAQNVSYKETENLLKEDFAEANKGFKLVKDNKWYIAAKVDDSSLFAIGASYPVYIDNEKTFEAGLVERIIEDRGGSVVVFSFNDNVEKYLDVRVTDIFVGQRFEGFSINKDYVNNGEIKIKSEKQKITVPVNVSYQTEDFVIFEVDEQLTVGQKVYK